MASPARRVLTSLNLLATLALLGALFILVNYLASRRYLRRDVTRQQIAALSDKTRQALAALKEPVSVIVFYQPSHRLYELIRDQLQEYERLSPLITAEYVDPEQDIARAKQLAKELEIEDLNLVVFRAGPPTNQVGGGAGGRHKYLSDTDLADYDYGAMADGGQPTVSAFKAEEAFTSTILSLTQGEAQTLWFTTGHGEKALDSPDSMGLADLKKALERQNMTAEPATLLDKQEIPSDVKLVVAPGPTRRFTDTELALLAAYLERGGRLLALIDPTDDTGLDSLLERWGVTLGLDVVVDPARQLPFVSAANLFVTSYTDHPIVSKMSTLMTLFPMARSVRPVEPAPEGLAVTALALTSDAGWGETTPEQTTYERNEGVDRAGPVSIAVAAERRPAAAGEAPAGAAQPRARLVVVGDSEFVVNAQLANVGNRDFLMSAVLWLTEQEQLIGIGPKTLDSIKLHLTTQQLTGVFWFSLLALPCGIGTLGVVMWLARRQ